ncbi:dihydroorotase [bacterium]|nr:dihydroorotase [bacterium]
MKRLHIKNGHLIDPKNKINGKFDVVCENGVVIDVLKPGQKVADAEVIDATGLVVSPGFVDLHTHLREPGFEYKETIESGTRAAAKGGFTSICAMANTNPVNDAASVTEFIIKQAKTKGIVNVFPIGALTKGLKGKELAPIGELKRAGCVALSDDGKCVENPLLMRVAMEYAKSFDIPVITHSVDQCLSAGGVMNEGKVSARLGLPGIPHEAEDIMIARDIYLAGLTGARLHIGHVATCGGVEAIERAKKKGLPVTGEVTPHHFTLTDEAVIGYRTEAKMAPPLRENHDIKALVQGLADGTIDAIATDHAPHSVLEKEVEFERAECGIIGLETALSLSIKLIDNKKITLEKIIATLTHQPAQIVALKKGSLEKGADADITIFDPEREYVIDENTFCSKSSNSPFMGMKVKGVVTHTLVAGKVVYSL